MRYEGGVGCEVGLDVEPGEDLVGGWAWRREGRAEAIRYEGFVPKDLKG